MMSKQGGTTTSIWQQANPSGKILSTSTTSFRVREAGDVYKKTKMGKRQLEARLFLSTHPGNDRVKFGQRCVLI